MPEVTASLGKLVVDERNGYIGLSRHENGKEPIEWFRITDIESPGLYCVKPRIGWQNKVSVSCEFICDIPSHGRHIKQIVKNRIFCKHRTYTKNSNYEEWDEPGTISIMRSIIMQTFSNAINSEWAALAKKLYFMQSSVQQQALCAMYLHEPYTAEQLDIRYQTLQKAFHDSPQELDMLNMYYHQLKTSLYQGANS